MSFSGEPDSYEEANEGGDPFEALLNPDFMRKSFGTDTCMIHCSPKLVDTLLQGRTARAITEDLIRAGTVVGGTPEILAYTAVPGGIDLQMSRGIATLEELRAKLPGMAVANDMQFAGGPWKELYDTVERRARTKYGVPQDDFRCWFNLYSADAGVRRFAPHFDTEDGLIVGLEESTWTVQTHFQRDLQAPYYRIQLPPGRAIYIPAGCGHVVLPSETPTSHLTIAFQTRHMAEKFAFFSAMRMSALLNIDPSCVPMATDPLPTYGTQA